MPLSGVKDGRIRCTPVNGGDGDAACNLYARKSGLTVGYQVVLSEYNGYFRLYRMGSPSQIIASAGAGYGNFSTVELEVIGTNQVVRRGGAVAMSAANTVHQSAGEWTVSSGTETGADNLDGGGATAPVFGPMNTLGRRLVT